MSCLRIQKDQVPIGNAGSHLTNLLTYYFPDPFMPSTLVTTIVQPSTRLDLPKQAAARYDGDQFFWSYTEEPHRTRRQAIIKAHPEV